MRSNNVLNAVLFSSLVAATAACAGPLDGSAVDDGTGGGDGDAVGDGGSSEDSLRVVGQPVDLAVPGPDLGIGGGSKLDPPTPALDACGGLLVNVDDTTDLSFVATTTGGDDDFKTWCGDSAAETSAPDVVYQLAVSDECVLHLTVTTSSFDPVLELRQGLCEEAQGGDYCANRSGTVEELVFHASAGSTYWAVIDGATADASGDFLLAVRCMPPVCGDGTVSPGEACDDGNTADDDGCSSTCSPETAPVAESCADLATGVPIPVSLGSITLPAANPVFSNAGASDDYLGSCAWETGGRDQVFEIVPDTDGTLTATVGLDPMGVAFCQPPDYDAAGCVDHTLFVRESDCEATTDLACQESNPEDLTNVLAFPVTAGTHYFVFVDGYNGEWYSSGTYTLNLVLE